MLRDQTCLLTGGSHGIGREIALEFARHGADVAVNYRSSASAARAVAVDIEAVGENAVAVRADVSDRLDVDWMADRIHDELGHVDVLVKNAGLTVDKKFEE